MLTPMARRWRHGVPLQLCIAALVVGTIVVVTSLNFFNTRRIGATAAADLAARHFSLVMQNIRSDVELNILPVLHMVQGTVPFVHEAGLKNFDDARNRYLLGCIQTLSSHKNILALNFGYQDGSFFSVTALRDNTVRQRYNAPEAATFALWAVAPDAKGTVREWWEFLAEDAASLSVRAMPPRYDPRTRDWYTAALRFNGPTLTLPYVFTTSREPGVACAAPFAGGRGVFSVNIMFKNFQDLLNTFTLTEHGQAFILDQQHRVVAGHTHTPQGARVSLDTSRLLPLGTHGVLPDGALPEVLGGAAPDSEVHTLRIAGEPYFFSYDDISVGGQKLYMLLLSPVKDFTGFAEKFFDKNLLFALISLCIVIPPAVLLSYRIGAVLKQLLEETLRVKAFNLKDSRPVSSRIYEVQRLAHAITSMKFSIRRRTGALQNMQNHLEQLVRERTKELVLARDDAQRATQAKSVFLSTVSHEIRTPLSAVIGFTHLFERSNLTPRQVDYLEKIRMSSESLLHIINDVLDFSKIEAGRLELEHMPFQPKVLVDAVRSIVSFSAQDKHLALSATVADDVPDVVEGDPARLRQVLLNLLNNAVKFTAMGSVALEVRVEPLSGEDAASAAAVRLGFSVSDTGIGMSPQQMKAIFQPFTQADNSIARRYGGTGLGLAICRQLVELMGGSIHVASKEGRGTTFRFTVPLKRAAAQMPPEAMPIGSGAPDAPSPRRGARVLVVDDNAINREIACALLENAGMNVETAADGREAVEKARTVPYDLVFMDMQMPVMDGLAAVRALRAAARGEDGNPPRPDLAALPIVAMTANALTEDRRHCLEAGMNDHISKPLMPDVLHALLIRWLPGEHGTRPKAS